MTFAAVNYHWDFLPGLRQKKHYGDNQRRDGDAGIGGLEFSHGFHLVSFCTG